MYVTLLGSRWYLPYLVSQAGLFSAVSSAFVIDVYPKLQQDSSDQSAALLHSILLSLNNSTIRTESIVVLPVQENPPSEIVTATALLYASLLISLLAAFIAMLGKQWLNRYLRHAGGSMIERCGDRQRKCDGLQKWPFHLFVESLPVMLQISLLLLACGLCRYMASVNAVVAYTLIILTGLGVLFYVGVVIAGASSYESPFQTPISFPLRRLWNNVWLSLIPTVFSITVVPPTLRKIIELHVFRVAIRLPHFDILRQLHSLLERVQLVILRVGFCIPPTGLNLLPRFRHPPPPMSQEDPPSPVSHEIIPWFAPGELAKIQIQNTIDTRCVSWVIRNITDPDALDAAIQRAGTIRWFDDGIDAEPLFDLIVSTFHACFGSDGEVYQGSSDRAYYSGRAILWIHTLAMCKSRTLPLPITRYTAAGFGDLQHLLLVIQTTPAKDSCGMLLLPYPDSTPSHSQWISNVLLHQSWGHIVPDKSWIHHNRQLIVETIMPLNAVLDRLLVFCNFLGMPVEEEALKIQDKSCDISYPRPSSCLSTLFASGRLGQVLNQVIGAITSSLDNPHPRYEFIGNMLQYLAKLENCPWRLTEIAYGWAAVIWENHQGCDDWESLLFLSLEVGFRCFDPLGRRYIGGLIHTEVHRELTETVFRSNKSEAIADLLCALTVRDNYEPAVRTFGTCVRHIVNLHNSMAGMAMSFSPRLRQLVMKSITLIGFEGFKEVGAESSIGLLNHLHIDAEEKDVSRGWSSMLLRIVLSPGGHRHLAIQSWDFLVKLTIKYPW